jgi:hypothetical protein
MDTPQWQALRVKRLFERIVASHLDNHRIEDSRHLRFALGGLDLHLRIAEKQKVIHGQVTSSRSLPERPLVTLLVDNEPRQTTTPDDLGEFGFGEVPPGNVTVEIFLPGRRVIAAI